MFSREIGHTSEMSVLLGFRFLVIKKKYQLLNSVIFRRILHKENVIQIYKKKLNFQNSSPESLRWLNATGLRASSTVCNNFTFFTSFKTTRPISPFLCEASLWYEKPKFWKSRPYYTTLRHGWGQYTEAKISKILFSTNKHIEN